MSDVYRAPSAGSADLASGLGIWVRNQFARWLGVFSASVNAIVMLLFLRRAAV